MQEQQLEQIKPEGTIDKIFELDCVYDSDQRQAHVDYTTKLQVPWAIQHKRRPGKVAIVASGPSASEYVDLLKDWEGEIWGINGAFLWMRHRGIQSTAFVGLDPEPILKGYLIETPDDATYYLAAQVHPEVFDHLSGNNVKLWFAADDQVKFPFGAVPIFGGSTCLGRAPNLAYHLGYREVHIFGCDSSFTKKSHVYNDEGYPPGTFPVEMHGKVFMTTRQMMQQACDFAEQMVEWARPGDNGEDPLCVSLYGEGLLQSMYADTLERGGYQQYLREAYKDGLTRKQRRALRRAAA
jgi:uncharacterized Rossmann fold enzyme